MNGFKKSLSLLTALLILFQFVFTLVPTPVLAAEDCLHDLRYGYEDVTTDKKVPNCYIRWSTSDLRDISKFTDVDGQQINSIDYVSRDNGDVVTFRVSEVTATHAIFSYEFGTLGARTYSISVPLDRLASGQIDVSFAMSSNLNENLFNLSISDAPSGDRVAYNDLSNRGTAISEIQTAMQGNNTGGNNSNGGRTQLTVKIRITGINKVAYGPETTFGPLVVEYQIPGRDFGPAIVLKAENTDISRPSDRTEDTEEIEFDVLLKLSDVTATTIGSKVCVRDPDIGDPQCQEHNPVTDTTLPDEFIFTAESLVDQSQFEGDPGPSCNNFNLGWMICQALRALYEAIDLGYRLIIIPLLTTQPIQQQDENGNTTILYSIWNNVRIISSILFVVIFVLAITGIGFSWFLSSYEIKKMLPRLAIGAVAAQLSWYVSAFIIDLFNAIGAGTHGLLMAPVRGIANASFDFSTLGGVLAAILVPRVGLSIFTGLGGAKGVLMTMLPIFFAITITIFFVIFVLAIRQVLIVLLVILSPLALVMWAAPGYDSITKKWWETFWKLMFMYPLIIALIAMGDLVSRMTIAGREGNIFFQLAAMIALFAPYVLIPATFSFAGGAIANIASGFSQRRTSLTERLFGSDDPYGRHGWRGNTRDYIEKYKQQREFKQRMQLGAFTNDARRLSGLPSNGLRGIRGSGLRGWAKNSRAIGKYFAMHVTGTALFDPTSTAPIWRRRLGAFATNGALFNFRGASSLGTGGLWMPFARRAKLSAMGRFASRTVDNRMSLRTKDAKKIIERLADFGEDETIYALFGDYDPFTGKALPAWAILEAKKWRDDQAMLNAGLRYMVTQAKTNDQWKQLRNHFTNYNPYTDREATIKKFMKDDGSSRQKAEEKFDTTSSKDHVAKKGRESQFETFNSLKMGMVKGAVFGTQSTRKDGKNRGDFSAKMTGSYVESRAKSEWARLHQAGKTDMDEATFVGYYKNVHGNDFGAIGDKGLRNALEEVNYDLMQRDMGSQMTSAYEMINEASQRMEEVDKNFDKLVEYDIRMGQWGAEGKEIKAIQENNKLSATEKKTKIEAIQNRVKDELKIAKDGGQTEVRIGDRWGVKPIDIRIGEKEDIAMIAELQAKGQLTHLGDPSRMQPADIHALSEADRITLRKAQLESWRDKTIEAVERSRNLAIELIESAGAVRPDKDGAEFDPNAPSQLNSLRDMDRTIRTYWRKGELELDDDYALNVLQMNDENDDLVRRNEEVKKQTNEELARIARDNIDANEKIAKQREARQEQEKRTNDIREEAAQKIEQMRQSDPSQLEQLEHLLHLKKVNEIIAKASPDVPLEVFAELVEAVKYSSWVDYRKGGNVDYSWYDGVYSDPSTLGKKDRNANPGP